ncbi:hypothetical protein Agabi119p4_8335 [Agaricus bisporus var. burnettii]|uniref:Integrase catalytic domain-containing protein n=1 Tax=Agaricus bisporus var. burnettii TaxID=192524 RepID=A0A8H7EYC4_AGABI|nr:hypothetical protein Agabi119p4_8335 [Agaricus bisporus var. burnettii]
MTPHRHWFKSYSPHRIPIRLADNSTVYSAGVGSVVFQPVVNGKETRAVEFTRVLHVPDLRSNLLSCLYLARHKGFNITISSHSIDFKLQGRTLFTATIHSNNSAELDGSTVTSETAFSVSTLPVDISLWHRRFIHHNYADVKSMISKDLVSGLKLESNLSPDSICEPCLAGKMHSHPFPSSLNHNRSPLELVHSDLHGPLPVSTHSGYKYWITFIDDSTRFRAVYLLKAKSEAFEAFKVYKSWAETQLGVKLRALQDDKGGEYMSKAFLAFTQEAGIERRHSTRNRPQQNGLAERANRTMGERITAMLSESWLPGSFWGECISSMVHVWNMLPTASLSGTTPFQAFYKRKPDVSHLRVWGCTSYVHVQRDKRNSIQPHYEKCVFIGYPAGYKGWKFYNPVTKRTVISERADFDERYFPGTSKAQLEAVPSFACLPEPLPIPNDTLSHLGLPPLQDEGGDNHFPPARPKTPTPSASVPPEEKPVLPLPLPVIPPFIPPVIPPVTPPQIHAPLPVTPPTAGAPLEPPHVPRRTGRVRKPPGQWWKLKQPDLAGNDSDSDDEAALLADSEFCEVEFAGAVSGADPRSYRLAMKSPDSDCWTEACNTEIFNLEANGTWELMELPPGKKVVNSGWVFKVKRLANGSIERYRARLVAKGYSQRPGFDFTEVFAPTFRPASLRLIIALAAREGYKMRSVDISSAFTYGELEEEIYMRQPEGYHIGSPNMVFRLRKSLYGLKQAARQWIKKLRGVLEGIGYTRLRSDSSIYIYSKGDIKVIVPVFIDDITLVSKSDTAMALAVSELSKLE